MLDRLVVLIYPKHMNYSDITKGLFLSRQNRFIAEVDIGGKIHTVHVKNTGRCRELFRKNAVVYLQRSNNPNRKTLYDLIAVYKGDTLVNVDSQSPNKAVREWLKAGGLLPNPTLIKPEVRYGDSRLDFYIENEEEKAFVEVKGVTLEKDGEALFPDAPTQRGRRHLTELIKACENGYTAAVIFLVQMKGCRTFSPNAVTDPLFADELKRAAKSGVRIIALDCVVNPNSIIADKKIKVKL